MMMKLKRKLTIFRRYVNRVLIALSVLLNVVTGGRSNQTFSARQYERKRKKKINLCWLIDILFFHDPDHCMMSWLYWNTHKNIRKSGKRYLQEQADVVVYGYTMKEEFYDEQPKQSNLDRLRRSAS